jgi:hypothetical protein
MEMREQHNQRIADAADLLADIRQHLLFGIAGLSTLDIVMPYWLPIGLKKGVHGLID